MSGTNILIPLHPTQYKSIQNLHKGRDVRTELPVEEAEEYKALRDNYAVIYEYMVNKGLVKDGEVKVFEARKSIRDATGTGEILGTVKEMTTNYLGGKAKEKPSEEVIKKASAPLSPPERNPLEFPKDPVYLKELAEFVKKTPSPIEQLRNADVGDDDRFYWYDSFLSTNNLYDFVISKEGKKTTARGRTPQQSGRDFLIVVPAKDPFTGKFDYFMAVRRNPYQDFDEIDVGLKVRLPRDVYRIRREYKDVKKLKDFLYDFETEKIVLSEDYRTLFDERQEYIYKKNETPPQSESSTSDEEEGETSSEEEPYIEELKRSGVDRVINPPKPLPADFPKFPFLMMYGEDNPGLQLLAENMDDYNELRAGKYTIASEYFLQQIGKNLDGSKRKGKDDVYTSLTSFARSQRN